MSTDQNGQSLAGITVDREAILRSLNLNPRDPKTQALLVVCERYGLDPLLKHMVLIQGTPYITRDGYLTVAHRSGQFDGMEVVGQSETPSHYIAKVAVYRRDMGRPFSFVGRFPKSRPMAKEYGPEMAVKVAEVQGLRRAFNVTGVGAADERWDDDDAVVSHVEPEMPAPALDVVAGKAGVAEARRVMTPEAPVASTRRPPPGRKAKAVADQDAPKIDEAFDVVPLRKMVDDLAPERQMELAAAWRSANYGSLKEGSAKPLDPWDVEAATELVLRFVAEQARAEDPFVPDAPDAA